MAQPSTSSEKNQAPIHIALAGNPNCGKTTLFNALTGLHYKVANYPGVTVERKEGLLPGFENSILIDLPGIYSLSGNSLDERIATRALLGQMKTVAQPDLVISVVDATNLERNLYLTSQLLDLGIPVIVVLNMIDIADRRGISIKKEILARRLGVAVVAVAANRSFGISELKEAISDALQRSSASQLGLSWLKDRDQFKQAALTVGELYSNQVEFAAPSSRFIVGCNLLSEALQSAHPLVGPELNSAHQKLVQSGIDPISFEATERYRWINEVVKSSLTFQSPDRKLFSDALDKIITHRIWGTIIFFVVMLVIFQSIFLWASIPMEYIDSGFSALANFVGNLLPPGQLRSLITEGVIAGVGSVIVFVPQIAILFLFLGILEDSGYLSRAAFLMDKLMRKCGLQGRSFIPLLSSFACAIPGILSTRTIPSFADRLATILIAPLMSCSARLPVYTLLIAAFIPSSYLFGFISVQGLVLLGMYLLGIFGAAGVAWLLKKTLLRGEPTIFVMEMPPFRWPSLKVVLRDVYDRIVTFLKSAGTIILACSIILWFLASYPKGDLQHSYAGKIGHFIEPAIAPLGYNWEIGVGLLASFAAREVFVSSLSTVYNVERADGDIKSLITVLKEKQLDGTFTLATALSLMVFYVFACQCMSTLAVCRRETGSWGWTAFMFGYMGVLAYVASFVTYRLSLYLWG